jgi:hypothetical protein
VTTVAIEVEFPVDVKLLAKQFASLPDYEQAEFFHEVQRYATATFKNGEYGAQSQWAYLGLELRKAGVDSPGWKFACDLGAFTMVHSYDWASRNLTVRS